MFEAIISQRVNPARYGYVIQTRTVIECTIGNGCQLIGEGDGSQLRTTIEHIGAQRCQGVWHNE